MQAADQAAFEAGIPSLVLMEHAGQAVADVAQTRWPQARRVLVLCGNGNNGGDGYVAARLLRAAGRRVTVLALSDDPVKLSPDAATMRRAYLAYPGAQSEPLTPESLAVALEHSDLVIDALFGSGLNRPLAGLPAEIVGHLNNSDLAILSIDLPSGLSADHAEPLGPHVQATVTVQLAGPKLASVLYPARAAFGDWQVADIGIPPTILEAHSSVQLLTPQAVQPLLPRRTPNAHKYQVGTVLVLAGSSRYQGAAVLCAHAALRAGAGLVTLAGPERPPTLAAEVIVEALSWDASARKTLAALAPKRQQQRVIGPGLGDDALALLPELIGLSPAPTVLDASALTGGARWRDAVQRHGRCVLTPHHGEAALLLGCPAAEIARDPLYAATTLAEQTKAVVVLKGQPTVIAAPDGRQAISTRGHPGMASGGTGDALAGLLGAWIAPDADLFERACAAVFVHGLAGELAARDFGDGLTAGDLITRLAPAWLQLTRGSIPQ
jgi:NAD(P)H-hydrate epimerase